MLKFSLVLWLAMGLLEGGAFAWAEEIVSVPACTQPGTQSICSLPAWAPAVSDHSVCALPIWAQPASAQPTCALPVSGEPSNFFKNNTEAGISVVNGNTKTESYNVKQSNYYSWGKNSVGAKGGFLESKNLGVLSAKKWDFSFRYERTLSKMVALFIAQGLESDRFAGYMQRYNTDLGGKFFLYQVEKEWSWITELGPRYSHQNSMGGMVLIRKGARLYSELVHDWNVGTRSELWLEYLPNFTDTRDWMLNGELSISAALTNIFSVKSAYLVKFHTMPSAPATFKTDSTFTTNFVAKF